MPKAPDPFYSRKPVPTELIQGEFIPGLSQDQAFQTRERKLSTAGPGGSDLRKFSDTFTPKKDPFYSRKPVPDSVIQGSGLLGVSKEEALIARERKLSTAGPGGTDLRKFSNKFTPAKDPFYSRKPVPDSLIKDDTPLDPIEKYENRERKLSMFQLTTDPFDELAGRRTSVVNDSALGVGRRRSSAIAPDAMHAAAAHHHSGFDGDHLEPIQSRVDGPTTTTTTTTTATTAVNGATRPIGIGETEHGMVPHRVIGGTDTSKGTTSAGSEVQPEAAT